MRRRRPDSRLSLTKSNPHCLSGAPGFGGHNRSPRGLFLRRRKRRDSHPRGIRVPSACGSAQTLHGVQGYAAADAETAPFLRQFTQTSPQIRISTRWGGRRAVPRLTLGIAEGRRREMRYVIWTYRMTSRHDAGLRSFLTGHP